VGAVVRISRLRGAGAEADERHRERHLEERRAAQAAWVRGRREDPTFRQMDNDCRRLGLSRAEWRRQVEQGIIEPPS
jgi:hypothetical protein